MVFKRSLKARAKNFCIKLGLIVVLFTTISILSAFSGIRGSVFSMTGIDIPVEITWDDQNANSRPASVTLRLKDGNTEIRSLTLTSANQDQTDSNKWVGVFDDVPYSANYVISEDAVSDYTITSNDLSPTLSSVTILNSTTGDVDDFNGATVNIGDSNFVVFRAGVNNYYYLWTLEEYSGTFSQRSCNNVSADLIAAVRAMTGNSTAAIDKCINGLPSDNITYGIGGRTSITGSEGNVSVYTVRPLFSIGAMSEIYYGNVTPAISNTVSFENIKNITTYNVSYQFTGSTLPQNANTLLPAAAPYEPGDTVTVAAEPTAAGYRFLGWQKDGSPISGTFSMPNTDVVITGSWEQFNGYFAPAVTVEIVGGPTYYRVLDTVTFTITVTNPESYPIHDVVVDELLSGATFTSGSGYTVVSNQQVNIPTIAAGGSVTLYATYQVPRDVTEIITNTVEITSATADNYYFFKATQDCIDSEDFEVRSWQDEPVVTGINSNSTTLYLILMLTGAIGIGARVVIINKKKITKGRK